MFKYDQDADDLRHNLRKRPEIDVEDHPFFGSANDDKPVDEVLKELRYDRLDET